MSNPDSGNKSNIRKLAEFIYNTGNANEIMAIFEAIVPLVAAHMPSQQEEGKQA